jgi:hypothetical protein
MTESIISLDVACRLADHDGEFAFEVVFLRHPRPNQWLTIADEARRKPYEHDRVVRDLAPHFLNMWPVIDTDAKYLSGVV